MFKFQISKIRYFYPISPSRQFQPIKRPTCNFNFFSILRMTLDTPCKESIFFLASRIKIITFPWQFHHSTRSLDDNDDDDVILRQLRLNLILPALHFMTPSADIFHVAAHTTALKAS
jgi:hypothetical protein